MDYERIHKVQMGVISPSKLRMKLLGVHNSRKKEGGSNSSRTSPAKLEEFEHAKNHLLTTDVDEQSSLDPSMDLKPESINPKLEVTRSRSQNLTRAVAHQTQSGGNLSTVHPMRSVEEDGNGYDSTSSFEFHRGERSSHHHSSAGPFPRQIPSKWNDAEKWIVNRQLMHQNISKKNVSYGHGNIRQVNSNFARNVSEAIADTKRIDSTSSSSQNARLVKEEEEDLKAFVSESSISPLTATQTVESVSMRDVGTEMTPIPSQEPSRTGTPMGATTPSQTPRSSTPSTPKREVASPKTTTNDFDNEKQELSEIELKLKTRREIAALGMQLGKTSIASWASKEVESAALSTKDVDTEQNRKAEYEAQAAVWEEAEKAKHIARYKREELKIQAWESHQIAKIEARMRKLEVLVEQMRADGHDRISQNVAEMTREVEERRADAEARKNQKAARTAQKAEQIRETGRIPAHHARCCSWFL